MRSKNHSVRLTVALAIFSATMLMTATRATAQRDRVLHSFSNDGTIHQFNRRRGRQSVRHNQRWRRFQLRGRILDQAVTKIS